MLSAAAGGERGLFLEFSSGHVFSFIYFILPPGERETVWRERENGMGKRGQVRAARGEGCGKLTYFSSHICIYTQGQVYLFPLGFNEGK